MTTKTVTLTLDKCEKCPYVRHRARDWFCQHPESDIDVVATEDEMDHYLDAVDDNWDVQQRTDEELPAPEHPLAIPENCPL